MAQDIKYQVEECLIHRDYEWHFYVHFTTRANVYAQKKHTPIHHFKTKISIGIEYKIVDILISALKCYIGIV